MKEVRFLFLEDDSKLKLRKSSVFKLMSQQYQCGAKMLSFHLSWLIFEKFYPTNSSGSRDHSVLNGEIKFQADQRLFKCRVLNNYQKMLSQILQLFFPKSRTSNIDECAFY